MKKKKASDSVKAEKKTVEKMVQASQELLDMVSGDFLGCMEEFNVQDRMCMKHCALSLRCAIESQHHIRSEILEEMFYARMLSDKLQ
jgi:hypothetical protein